MLFPTDLLGYIDPASGSIVFQAIIAGVLGVVWRVASLFGRRRKVEAEQAEQSHSSETKTA